MGAISSIIESIGGISTAIGSLGGLGIGLFGIFGIISAVDKAIKEVEDVIIHLKKKYAGDKKLREELNQAIKAIANVLDKIPGLKKHAARIRNTLSDEGVNPWG